MPVHRECARGRRLPLESGCPGRTRSFESRTKIRVAGNFQEARSDRVDRERVEKEGVIAGHFAQRRYIRRQDRSAARHGFQHGEAESLENARQNESRGSAIEVDESFVGHDPLHADSW